MHPESLVEIRGERQTQIFRNIHSLIVSPKCQNRTGPGPSQETRHPSRPPTWVALPASSRVHISRKVDLKQSGNSNPGTVLSAVSHNCPLHFFFYYYLKENKSDMDRESFHLLVYSPYVATARLSQSDSRCPEL